MPVARFGFGACHYLDSIIVVSGIDGVTVEDQGQEYIEALLECDRYYPYEDEWVQETDKLMPNLPEGRTNPSVIALNHHLYVIGGIGETGDIF
jgi:hypothetical protein